MRIGILTSYRVPCGVAQYSLRMGEALREIGQTPVILGGRADEHRSVPSDWPYDIVDVAGIGLWRDDQQYWLNVNRILELELDAIHVQYQSMLFKQEDLAKLAAAFRGPKAITYHDKCVRPDFPHDAFDLHFAHRWDLGPPTVEVIPFGIEDRPPVIRTFGLGRTQEHLIAPLCERNGWIFESAANREPIHGPSNRWKSHEDLIQWLRGADAIILWYGDQDMAGSSQGARTALAARRPLFVNDVTWFQDMPTKIRGFRKVNNLTELESHLIDLLDRPYVRENSWVSVAGQLVDCYRRVQTLV